MKSRTSSKCLCAEAEQWLFANLGGHMFVSQLVQLDEGPGAECQVWAGVLHRKWTGRRLCTAEGDVLKPIQVLVCDFEAGPQGQGGSGGWRGECGPGCGPGRQAEGFTKRQCWSRQEW